MLKLKYLYENFDLAKECLSLYDVDKNTVDEMLVYFRISSNAIYPFRNTAGKVCFLRLSPVEEKATEAVASEIRLIQWLRTRDFPAMKPYAMLDGSLLAVRDTKWGTMNVSCFEGVEGKTLENCEGLLELIVGYGRTLGLLHQNLKAYPEPESRSDHKAFLLQIRDRFVAYHAPKELMKEWESVDKTLEALPIRRDIYGVVHYDFEPDNVMFCEETGAFGVIDFDDAIQCWYALDIVRALDALEDVSSEDARKSEKGHFCKGTARSVPYQRNRWKPFR